MKIFYTLVLFTAITFAQNSKETYKEYHDNGELKLVGEIMDLNDWGKSKIGDWKFYDEKGMVTEIYSFHPFSQQRPAQIKKFEEGKLKSHIIYDIARYKQFELDVLNKIYTLFEVDEHYDDDVTGKVIAKIEITLNNEKLETLQKSLSESNKYSISDFRYLIDEAVFSDNEYIVNHYDGDTYLGYKNHINGDVLVYYTEFKKGQIKEKGNCINGEITFYHENGQIKEIGQYKKGFPAGVWKEYNENGKLINKERK